MYFAGTFTADIFVDSVCGSRSGDEWSGVLQPYSTSQSVCPNTSTHKESWTSVGCLLCAV